MSQFYDYTTSLDNCVYNYPPSMSRTTFVKLSKMLFVIRVVIGHRGCPCGGVTEVPVGG